MQCLNCGKSIPFVGNDCPYCHTRKGASQTASLLAFPVGVICAIPAGIYFGWWGALIGLIVGMAVVYGVMSSKAKSKRYTERYEDEEERPRRRR